MTGLTFPDGFLWGASSSAHQTEGNAPPNDWRRWERQGKAPRLGDASGSWERWADDLDVARELGLGVYRISLEWARLQPESDRFDDEAFDHYAQLLTETRRRGIKTMVTLWHFTHPVWFAERGGWDREDAPVLFGEYARRAAERLGPLVDYWATINEADTYVAQGYVRGVWPPGRRHAWLRGWRAYMRLAEAHKAAHAAIKTTCGWEALVGLTHAFTWAKPEGPGGALLSPAVRLWNYLANDAFINATWLYMDWLGVQYYLAAPIRLGRIALGEGDAPLTDMGWRIDPRGLYEVVMRAWRRYRLPVIVTENGLADAADAQRARFILDHLAWLHRAIERGADVRGYLHWSLVDNYEWSFGTEMRFGLAEVDFETLERRIRPSARVYAGVAAANALPEGLRPDLRYADGRGSLAPHGRSGAPHGRGSAPHSR